MSRYSLLVGAGLALSACQPDQCRDPTEGTLGELSEWERAFLDRDGLPDSPGPKTLVGGDGLELAYYEWLPEDWDGTGSIVVVVPGSSAHGELYAVWGAGLRTRGVMARVLDVRGHGRSVCDASANCGAPPYATPPDDGEYYVGRKGDALDEDQLIRDLALHVADLHRRWPDAELVLAGHSSGAGLISRHVQAGGLAHVDRVALVAPFNHYQQPQNRDVDEALCEGTAGSSYAQIDLGALGAAMRGQTHRYVVDFVKDEALTTELDTLRYTHTMLRGMSAEDPHNFLPAYTQPTLWVAAERDALFDLETSRIEFERMPGGAAFVTARDTTHVGLSWSTSVADLLADWATDPGSVEDAVVGP